MTAKEWLNRGWRVQQEIELLQETKVRLYERAVNVTAKYTGLPGAVSPDPHVLDGFAEYCARVDARAQELTRISSEILCVIRAVEDPRYRRLLTFRYLNYLPWTQVAQRMHRDLRWVYRLHNAALQAAKLTIESHYPGVL